MPLFLQHTEPLWGVWEIKESSDRLLSGLACREEYRLALADMRTEKRRQEWLAVRVLLKALLGEETRIAYRPDGSPYLPDKDLFISISHTSGYAAVILNAQTPTGIDIEARSDRILKVRSRFMQPKEDLFIHPEHPVEHLLVCWCAKEVAFKLMGQSQVDFREHLHIAPFPYAESGSLILRETRTPQAASYQLNYLINKYFAMGWFREIIMVN